jgi:hypothetical protein
MLSKTTLGLVNERLYLKRLLQEAENYNLQICKYLKTKKKNGLFYMEG